MRQVKYIFFLFLIAGFGLKAQQLPVVTNYLLNDYAYNPAVAGARPFSQIMLNYRAQWMGFDGAPRTSMISAFGGIRKKPMGWGLRIVSDKVGLLQRTALSATYAYHVKLGQKMKLGLALSPGIQQYRVRLYEVKVADAGDEMLQGNIQNSNVFDATGGMYLYSEKFFFGVSGYQAVKTKIPYKNSDGTLIPHIYSTIGYTFQVNKKVGIQPSLLIKYSKPVPMQAEAGLRGIVTPSEKVKFWIGGTYRVDDSFSALLGAEITEKLVVGYSYDIMLSGLKQYASGSHEIVLAWQFVKKKEKLSADEEEFNNIDNSIRNRHKNN